MTTIKTIGFKYPDCVRAVLEFRNVQNRFAIDVKGGGLCPRCRYSVGELRERGYIVQLDLALMNGRDVFVFLLTRKGVMLCAEEGIDAR